MFDPTITPNLLLTSNLSEDQSPASGARLIFVHRLQRLTYFLPLLYIPSLLHTAALGAPRKSPSFCEGGDGGKDPGHLDGRGPLKSTAGDPMGQNIQEAKDLHPGGHA